MALYSGRLLMRGGNEADFNPDKMMPREWAVSTDKKIVRICIAPGVCIRIATYEAFEEDMAKIEEILKECQSIQEAVVRINTEVSQNADAVAEYTTQAKQYRDEAKQFRDEAFAATPDGYAEVVETVAKNTVKIDTVIEKADLGIKETASGEEIHLTDSAEGKVVEFALFGKARQNTTSGKNLLENKATSRTINGVTFTVNEDKSVTMVGEATENTALILESYNDLIKKLPSSGTIILSGCTDGSNTTYDLRVQVKIDGGNAQAIACYTSPVSIKYNSIEETTNLNAYINIQKGAKINTTIYPMISIEGGEYEPFTNGVSPNPDYPQEIEVSGESYNLLENTATSQTINGVTFTVNEDKSVTVNGTSDMLANYLIGKCKLERGKRYILNGCPRGGSDTKYRLDVRVNISTLYGSELFDYGNGVKIVPTENVEVMITLRYNSGTIFDNLTFYPMIRKASVKNNRFMPYGKGSVEVKSCGKNLLKNTATSQTVNGVTFTVNEDGSITLNETKSAVGVSLILNSRLDLAKGNSYIITDGNNVTGLPCVTSNVVKPDGTSISDGFTTYDNNRNIYTCEEDGVYIKDIRLWLGTAEATYNNLTLYPMIRRCDENGNPIGDDTYEPYKETTATIPTPNGLAGIPVESGGNYTGENGQQRVCDVIVKYADGSGEETRKIKKIDLSTITNWTHNPGWNNASAFVSYDAIIDASPAEGFQTIPNFICNRLQITTAAKIASYDYGLGQSDRSIYCAIDGITTSEDLISYFSNNETYVYYELAEPIRTPLTAEQIAEIEKLCTFYPVTNISNDADCGMEITYMADAKNYIDNRLALIETAMLSNI